MSITSYAQNFEDVMLWRALGHVPKGFYIDIGAQHPVTDSVSKAFYEKGWRGIHVEATPAYAALLRQDRPDETVIEAAVNDVHGVIRFFEIPATGISTGDPDVARNHQGRGFDVHEMVVPCITLEDIFKQAGTQAIHWLKVDVESMEQQVLRSWGQSPARPWVVVVESTVPLTQIDNHLPWESSLLERGYTHAYFDGLNRYYLAADQHHLASAFASGPNVFDGFNLSGDASAPFCAAINGKHRLAQQALQDQLSAKEQQARQLQEQHAAQTAQHQALANQWQAELQTLQAQRKEAEHDHALKELALQQLASRSYQQAQSQAQNHLQNLVQREQACAAQLQDLQSQLNAAQQDAHQRALVSETEARAREQALLDNAAAELKSANHQAQARLDALSQSHQRQANVFQAEKAHLQQRLEQAHADSKKQLLAFREQQAAHQRALVSEIEARSREQALLRSAAAELKSADHQAQARLDALSQSHQRQANEFRAEKAHLQQCLEQAHAQSQKHLQALAVREQEFAKARQELDAQHHQQQLDWTAQQKELSHQIAQLKTETRLLQAAAEAQAQQHKYEIEMQMSAHQGALADCAALQAQHKAEMLNEQRNSQQLMQALAEVRSALAATQATWSWRATAPLRVLFSLPVISSTSDRWVKPKKTGSFNNSRQEIKGIRINELDDECRFKDELNVETLASCFFEVHPVGNVSAVSEGIGTATASTTRNINLSPSHMNKIRFQPKFQVRKDGVYRLDDFMTLYDRSFVNAMYRALLGRDPDSEGEKYYLNRLRTGVSKVSLVHQMCQSPEAKKHGAKVAGLPYAMVLERIYAIPIFGSILRAFVFLATLDAYMRDVRALENHVFRLAEETQKIYLSELDRIQSEVGKKL